MQQYPFSDKRKTTWEKNIILVSIAVLLALLGVGGISQASIAIHDDRATDGYWTARNPDGDALYLTQEEISSVNQAMREKTSSLTDLLNYPQTVGGAEVKELILSAQQDFRGEKEPGEHYDKGGMMISQEDYNAAQDNCNLDAVPASAAVRYGVVTMRTDMRLLPTTQYYFDDKSFQHYDDLQGTALDPCEPLLVLHTSKDGAFAFAIGRYYKGWVSLGAIGFTERKNWEKYVSPKNFLVVTDHKKKVHVGGTWDVLFQMGSVIPLKSPKMRKGAYQAIIPVEINGHLSEAPVLIKADSTVNPGYLPCTPNNFVRQSLKFLDDVYGWGGMEESVDCSSYVQDVYRSMGILLPRDADQQELAMKHSVSLNGLDTAARYQKTAEAPVGALLFKPGHVMLYLGKDDRGTPLAIHSASSYFTFLGGKAQKHYIRQVLISDMTFQNGKGIATIDGMTSIGRCFP
ncbi:SH3 domain (SH3b1 type) [Selenomonas ruminantium]|uniref:SH3 domain (SH3b1 type) n=1 Tax=Selenomonas ruminantium TaxID=971 RepID=A0A1M6RJ32_SELRU|nr:NlpC/P60 family protein [Selenomonas ruminantium]SHK32426.1 SH3 domain (SH3b1 type) [Selenomonas ruminantium]